MARAYFNDHIQPLWFKAAKAIGSYVPVPPYDPDAIAYFARAGVTNDQAKQQISDFIIGLKALGVWDSMIDGWALKSYQNAGTGSIAYGLKSINGTLTNGPTWTQSGINFNLLSARIQIPLTVPQPFVVYGFVNFDHTPNGGSLMDGTSRVALYNGGGSGLLTMFAGSLISQNPGTQFLPGQNFIACVANGASSSILLNGALVGSGNPGTNQIGNPTIIVGNNNPMNFGNQNLTVAFFSLMTGGTYNDAVRSLYNETLGN